MNVCFADTSFLVAYLNPDDEFHDRACDYMADEARRFVTTGWVLIELANYLAKTRHRRVVGPFVRELRREARWTIEPVAEDPLEVGLSLYARRPDKAWSLTDCISFTLMRQQKIVEAATTDHHFNQAGFTALLR